MYPPKFDYYRAESVDEALSLMGEHADAKLLAGGHSLIPVMKLRLADPGVLIDIGRISAIKGICTDGDKVMIGALTTHTEVENSAELPAALPEAASWIADPSVRNRGTVGGNVAHADPASDLPTVLMALDATFHMQSASGKRSVGATDFFTDLFETALAEDEILTTVEVSAEGSGSGSAYAKLFNPASRYAMVGAAASVDVSNGTVNNAKVAIGGLINCAKRCAAVEAALNGAGTDAAALDAAAKAVLDDLPEDQVIGDMHASAEYRRAVAPAIVRQALSKAVARAIG
jgi:carbon-monoxide dehydrogenase medium subunit